MSNNGILFLAFGDKYHKMGLQTIAYSRKYTDIPFCVLTNVKNSELSIIPNTLVKYIMIETANNREIKTQMYKYSPFDNTIYIDIDSVIQRPGIENVFEMFKDADLILNTYGIWQTSAQSMTYYTLTMNKLNAKFPIYIYYGAFIGFNKNAQLFFDAWNRNWKKSGIAREMPALACTMQLLPGLKTKKLHTKDNIFSWRTNKLSIIQHEYGHGFWVNFFRGNNNV